MLIILILILILILNVITLKVFRIESYLMLSSFTYHNPKTYLILSLLLNAPVLRYITV